MEHYTLHVTGMSCTSCERILSSELTKLSGVSSVEADASENTVHVDGSAAAEPQVREAVVEVGYEVVE